MIADGQNLIYALDIGTRCVVGVVGTAQEDRFKVLDIELAEHHKRAMIDGQIDNIQQVAALAKTVTRRLEDRLGVPLRRVCVAAAGRALQTEQGSFSLEVADGRSIDAELISRLEAGAVSEAECALRSNDEAKQQFFLVGYTVSQYRLDGYPLTALLDHSGKLAEVDIVATFLPGEVVESLYAAMRAADLQIVSMTLEPIAAMNAAIPAELRMLNLALADIGAGTTDIALCKDGSVVGYTMATIAGDEITEAIMRAYLVDFQTAEQIKRSLRPGEPCCFKDILGLDQTYSYEEVCAEIEAPMNRLADAISEQILSANGTAPSAVFLAGGGSKLNGLREKVASSLGMDERRVAIAGNNFAKSVFSDSISLDNPEYTTPLGIAVSAGMGLLNDSYVVMLNDEPAKLFKSGTLSLRDVLLMNGYTYSDMLGGTGKSMSVTLDGRKIVLRGEPAVPAVLRLNDTEAAINTPIQAGDRIRFIPAQRGADANKTLGQLLGEDFCGRVLVNNEECSMDTPLKHGDVVLTLEKKSPSNAGEEQPTSAAIQVSEEPQNTEDSTQSAPPREFPTIRLLLNEQPLTLPGKEDGQPYYLMDLLEHSGIDFEHLDRAVYLAINGNEAGFREIVKDQDHITIRCV